MEVVMKGLIASLREMGGTDQEIFEYLVIELNHDGDKVRKYLNTRMF